MKPVMMIHEVANWMFDVPLEDYILTFDDALYTQYVHFDRLKQINTEKIFFVSTGVVAEEDTIQDSEFITCERAHAQLWDTGDLKHYMKWSQLQEIAEDPLCEIGAHSHLHGHFNTSHVMDDTKLMLETFAKHGMRPTSFCFPYNEYNSVYAAILLHNGFTKLYGAERENIYDHFPQLA